MWLLNSSIGRKLIMSISGIFLVLFLLFHMSMNVVALFSAEGYNTVCGFLGSRWYAVLGTAVLAGGFLVHIVYATWLTILNKKARGTQPYERRDTPKGVEFASQNMYILGVIVVAGLLLHLSQFWYHMMFAELAGIHNEIDPTDGAAFIQYYFSQPVIVICYLVWLGALWLHLCHGFWSALHTIGWNNLVWLNRMKCISTIFATVVIGGFLLVVIGFFLKSVLPCLSFIGA